MKDIMLKITGKTLSAIPANPDDPNNEQNTVEFITAGKMVSRGGVTRISYDETELSGMEGCKTQITISSDKLKMQRVGKMLPSGTCMEFEKGKRYHGSYATPYGNVAMEILTNNINVEDTSNISINYSLSIQGIIESNNELKIEVMQ